MVEPMLIQHSLNLNARLSQYVDGLDIPASERSRFANASFSFVMDCHSAIGLLVNRGLHGPSIALVRVTLEALLRGYWFHWCADEQRLKRTYDSPEKHTDQIEHLFNDLIKSPELKRGHYPKFEKFLSYHLGKDDQRENEERAKKSKRIWKALNSYAHAGTWQLTRYQSEDSIERNFDIGQVREVILFSNCCICWASMGVCETANMSGISNKIYDEFTEVVIS